MEQNPSFSRPEGADSAAWRGLIPMTPAVASPPPAGSRAVPPVDSGVVGVWPCPHLLDRGCMASWGWAARFKVGNSTSTGVRSPSAEWSRWWL